jgi:hypothetical protein
VPKLERAEIERSRRKPTESLGAYDYYLRGMAAMHLLSREGSDEALAHFDQAIQLDPSFAAAHGVAARCYSGTLSPLPPNSDGKSFIFGKPSFMGNTVSA